MGYFSNGTEGFEYEAKYCSRCVHNDEDNGCPVMNTHFLHNYTDNDDVKEILNMFIPRDDENWNVTNEQCKMFMEAT